MVDLDDLGIIEDILGGSNSEDDKSKKLDFDSVISQLPKTVRNIDDFKEMMALYNSLDFTSKLNKSVLQETIDQIYSDEKIFFIYNATNFKTTSLRNDETTKTKDGATFISNKRVYFKERKSNNYVLDFPIAQIRSTDVKTGLMGGNISFTTDIQRIEMSLLGFEIDVINMIHNVFSHVVAYKGKPPIPIKDDQS